MTVTIHFHNTFTRKYISILPVICLSLSVCLYVEELSRWSVCVPLSCLFRVSHSFKLLPKKLSGFVSNLLVGASLLRITLFFIPRSLPLEAITKYIFFFYTKLSSVIQSVWKVPSNDKVILYVIRELFLEENIRNNYLTLIL